MVKKYTDNYRLDIAYATIFRNLKPIEEIPIHTAMDITSGDNLTKKDMVPGDHIVYGGGGETGNTHSEFNIDYKTIGIGRVGARCGCVFEIIPNSWVTDNALIIQSYDKRFSLSFLRHFLSYSDLGQYANNAMQPVISKTRINDVTIPLIDIEEQHTLSKILDSIEKNEKFESNDYDLLKSKIEIIDNWETLNVEIEIQKDLTAQLKQSILQEAIQGKLTSDWRASHPELIEGYHSAEALLKRIKAEKNQLIKDNNPSTSHRTRIKKEKALPPITEEEIPFKLPVSWVWCRLDDLVQTNAGKTLHKGQNTGEFKDYITTSNLYWGEFKLDNVKQIQLEEKELERCTARRGDLLICEGGDVGRSAIWDKDYEICFQNHIHRVRPYDGILNTYLYYFMRSLYLSGGIIDYKKGMGIGNLSGKALKSITLPICSFAEQKAIVEKVETLMQKCQALEQEIQTSETHAQMLMQAVLKEAFEGKQEDIEV